MFLCYSKIDIKEYFEEYFENRNYDNLIIFDEYILKFCSYIKYNDIDEINKSIVVIIIYKNNFAIRLEYEYLDKLYSFNEIEFYSLIFGLKIALKLKIKNIKVQGSNWNIIDIMNNNIISKNITKLYNEVKILEKNFDLIKYEKISLEKNSKLYNLSKKLVEEYN